ncbi:MAG TPA: nucleotide sugar dehydrogenase [Methylomirabilota bacterium]|jgi:UDP-N-acetyl-D-glucosamine dehydrogenase|nr:nucleotide sugar dehydrogenase [Methylomirabilota bacterium]
MSLLDRIEDKTARIAVIGQGYVGLPLAVEFARSGFRVTGIDADPARVAALARGESYIPDVPEGDLRAVLEAGRFVATCETAALAEQDAIVICVPTPLRKSKDPDISSVLAAAGEVARHLRPGQLVVLESTTFPGTTDEVLLPMFQQGGLRAGADFHLAFSPERIDPANASFTVKEIPKLVGGVTPACTAAAAALYRQIVARVIELSRPIVAELAKLYENTFRSVNIALANEMAVMCHRLGVSTWEVIEAAASKPFGFMAFYPGPGIGGHCIPIDPLYLSWKVRHNGYEAKFIGLADEMNRAMPRFVLDLLAEALNDAGQAVRDARVLVLGVAYKRGVGDVRESPALEIVEHLLRRGARVRYADPFVPSLVVGEQRLEAAPLTADLLRWSDAVLIVTDHPQFDYGLVIAEAPLVVDARNATAGLPPGPGRIVRL